MNAQKFFTIIVSTLFATTSGITFAQQASLGGMLSPVIEYIGPFEVLSGDTFRAQAMQDNGNVAGRESSVLRLEGLNAFIRAEHTDGQPLHQHCKRADGAPFDCGEESFQALKKNFSENPDAICRTLGSTQVFMGNTVMLVSCITSSGKKIGAELVLQGWAISDPDQYINFSNQEQTANTLGNGAHAGTYKDPYDLLYTTEDFGLAIQPAAIGTPDLPLNQAIGAQ